MSYAIEVENLHKVYKNKHAVQGVSFSVEKGEIFGIVGPNGAGKTTTIEILEGLRKKDNGKISILGLDPEKKPYELRQKIGIQFQSTSIQERMKVKEAIHLFSSFYEKKGDIPAILEKLGLDSFMDTQFTNLSGGWKQRLTLALAIIHDPEIIFLDEPSTGLDPGARRDMWSLIRNLQQEGKTIVVTTHYMEEAEQLCDRVAMFKEGQIVALDTPKHLVNQFLMANYLTFISDDADLELLRNITGANDVSHSNETIKIQTHNLQDTSLELFQLAKEKGWKIDNFRFEVGSLDDLFVQMAGKEQSP
ncbi:MAG TPA: ABC transporter ATP-binding protein [Paenibacillaceae bacterium]|nr:ABC transporter ATP-binding protein [Paenibacillaceae bacterium]